MLCCTMLCYVSMSRNGDSRRPIASPCLASPTSDTLLARGIPRCDLHRLPPPVKERDIPRPTLESAGLVPGDIRYEFAPHRSYISLLISPHNQTTSFTSTQIKDEQRRDESIGLLADHAPSYQITSISSDTHNGISSPRGSSSNWTYQWLPSHNTYTCRLNIMFNIHYQSNPADKSYIWNIVRGIRLEILQIKSYLCLRDI